MATTKTIEFANNVSLRQAVELIKHAADKRTVLVQGHMGSGKSTMLKMLAKMLPEYHTGYFDMTNIDLGDLMLPAVQHEHRETEFYPNSLFGMRHGDIPHIYMFDEFGKAARPLQNAVLPVMLERRVGARKIHPASLVFATTNLGAEGVGDMLQAHSRNRMIVITMRKPTADEWIEDFAVSSGVLPEVMAWVRETPQCMQGFEEFEKPDDNPYIFHPKAQRDAFVTPRSLEAASDLLKVREHMEADTVLHALRGTVGDRAALDMRAFVQLADKLPAWKSVIADPKGCPVPTNPAAVVMLMFTAVSRVTAETVTPWMAYLNRVPKEAQALFCFHAMKQPKVAAIVAVNKAFTEYALANQYLY